MAERLYNLSVRMDNTTLFMGYGDDWERQALLVNNWKQRRGEDSATVREEFGGDLRDGEEHQG